LGIVKKFINLLALAIKTSAGSKPENIKEYFTVRLKIRIPINKSRNLAITHNNSSTVMLHDIYREIHNLPFPTTN
jgi:hypothetical protein